MARVRLVDIYNYRSIKGPLQIRFPDGCPIVLLGENNAGKSNIVKAVDLVLGQYWPGSHDPEDHEFFNREREYPIRVRISFDPAERFGGRYRSIAWSYDPEEQKPSFFGSPDN